MRWVAPVLFLNHLPPVPAVVGFLASSCLFTLSTVSGLAAALWCITSVPPSLLSLSKFQKFPNLKIAVRYSLLRSEKESLLKGESGPGCPLSERCQQDRSYIVPYSIVFPGQTPLPWSLSSSSLFGSICLLNSPSHSPIATWGFPLPSSFSPLLPPSLPEGCSQVHISPPTTRAISSSFSRGWKCFRQVPSASYYPARPCLLPLARRMPWLFIQDWLHLTPSGHWGLCCGPQPHLPEALGRRTGPLLLPDVVAPHGCLSEGVCMFT